MMAETLEPIVRGPALDSLKALMDGEHRPLALVGAGVSVSSGYPTWKGLIEKLSEQAAARRAPSWYGMLKESNDAAWQAEEYRTALTPKLFDVFIKQTFKPKPTVDEPHHAIAALPFRHLLTTNYDTCCEEALRKTTGKAPPSISWDQTERLNAFLIGLSDPRAPRHVVHIHGHYRQPSKLVLTEESYVRRYVKSEDARRKLFAIFMTNPVVFIGFSMDDPDLAQMMREVAARARSPSFSHYVIMAYRTADEREAIARRMELKFGVKVVFYSVPKAHDDHSNLTALLRYLKTGEMPASTLLDSKPPPPAPPVPTSVPAPGDPPPGPKTGDGIDPNKGMFGGLAEREGLRLRIENATPNRGASWLTYDLVVDSPGNPGRLTGKVRFRLHPTFREDDLLAPVKNERAVLKHVGSYGAFTVGVVTQDGLLLELDLAEVESLPKWFREA